MPPWNFENTCVPSPARSLIWHCFQQPILGVDLLDFFGTCSACRLDWGCATKWAMQCFANNIGAFYSFTLRRWLAPIVPPLKNKVSFVVPPTYLWVKNIKSAALLCCRCSKCHNLCTVQDFNLKIGRQTQPTEIYCLALLLHIEF